MDRGTVRWFDAVKGIGFIVRDRDGNEVAVQSMNVECAEPPQAPAKQRKPRKRKKSADA